MTTSARANILAFVRRYPAVHVREVERRLHLSDRLAAYHLAALERDGLVRAVRERGFVRFWPAESQWDKATMAKLRVVRREPAYKVVLLLLQESELPQGEIAKHIGLGPPATSYHLRLLTKAGLVATRESGRNVFYRLDDPKALKQLLRRLPPVPGSLDEFTRVWDDLVG